MLIKIKCCCLILFFILRIDGYRTTKNPQKSVPLMKNSPYVYRGQVFILRETDDPKRTFLAEIVNGGIEMIHPSQQKLASSLSPLSHPSMSDRVRVNDSLPDVLEDPEYFAVMVTPETAALTQISHSTIVEIPLSMLLTAFSKRMPWVLVLKRKNHYEYFRNIEPSLLASQQPPMLMSQRRRSRSQSTTENVPHLVLDSRKYDFVYSEKDKAVLQNICVNVVQELSYMNALLNQFSNGTESINLERILTADINEMKTENEKKVDDTSPMSMLNKHKSIDNVLRKN